MDTSLECRTAETLLKHMESVIAQVEQEWKVPIVAFTLDAAGDSKKACRLLHAKRPDIFVPDCMAHQVS